MRQSRPLLPIRPLELPARLGRRQRRHAQGLAVSFTDARVRFEQHNLAVARASHPVWLRGPLFQSTSSQPSFASERHAA